MRPIETRTSSMRVMKRSQQSPTVPVGTSKASLSYAAYGLSLRTSHGVPYARSVGPLRPKATALSLSMTPMLRVLTWKISLPGSSVWYSGM